MRFAYAFVILLLLSIAIAVTTTNNHFQVVPNLLMLNWTNNYSADVFIYFSKDNVTVELLNSTTFTPIYGQQNTLTRCTSLAGQGYTIIVQDKNSTIFNNTFSYSSGDNITISLIDVNNAYCNPGRYFTNSLLLQDKNNATEYVNLTIYVDIPITQSRFHGSIQNGYHSFYFNSSLLDNASYVLINITPKDSVGIFLVDNGSIIASSVGDEIIEKIKPEKFYEIRVSGNQTYIGNLILSGLNSSFEGINFGVLNSSQSNSTIFTIENNADSTENNLIEKIELYHLDEFSGNSASNFTFFVPAATSIKAVLNWLGNSGFVLNLYNSSNIPVKSSSRVQTIFKNASVNPQEYLTFNVSPGIWMIEVKNLTVPSQYNLTIYQLVPSYITTNFSSISLNKGDKIDINASLLVHETTWNGRYEGYIKYSSNKGALKIPISFNVTTPVLLINNTINFNEIKIKENYGNDAIIRILLPLNNTGIYSTNLTFLSSDGLTYLNDKINITLPTNIQILPFSMQYASINFSYNSSAPKGIYKGWIYINTTDQRASPRGYYNISVELELTDQLIINLLELKTSDNSQTIKNVSMEENTTAKFKIFYINGTEIADGSLGLQNFQIWLNHANLSYRVPTSGSLSIFNGTNPIYAGGDYEINFTVPANILGGIYNTFVSFVWPKNVNYTATASNTSLVVNNTALYMHTQNSTSLALETSKSTTFVVNVTNYGERSLSSYTIRLNESCSGYSVSALSLQGCSGSMSGDSFTITPQAYSSCALIWKIEAGSTNASSCTAHVIATPSHGWYDPSYINLSVVVRTPQSNTATTTTIAEEELLVEEKPEVKYFSVEMNTKVSVEQGKNKSLEIKVRNLYTKTQAVKILVSSINSSWFIVSPSSEVNIVKNDYYIYRVIFSVPEDANLGDYKGKIRVESKYNYQDIDFTLSVLPGDSLKNLINVTINSYEQKIRELEEIVNASQNETIKARFEEIKSKVAELKSYIDKNDYQSAYNKLYDVKKLLDEFQITQQEVTQKPKAYVSWPMILIGGSGALFVSALGYTAFDSMKKKGFSFKVKNSTKKIDAKKELKEIKESLKLKELEEEIIKIKEKEKELEEEIKSIEEKEKELEKS